LKTSIKTITYLSDTGCLEIQGASLLDINDPDFPEQYQRLLARLDYLTKLDTKASGQRNFGYSGF
ncbi:inovirus-type Gp2 protein, partial [Escherichia coli]